ncbi:MAG: hypothetical protein IKK24_04210, partial [Clostridia bacterium]|nr:hypothetical protein [Clostridia bacterium]
MIKKLLVLFIVALVFISCSTSVSAKTVTEYDYILSEGKKVPIPKTHKYVKLIDYIEGYISADGDEGILDNPQDMVIDSKGNIYIADTGNNAIVKLDSDGKMIYSITESGGKNISYPLGLFIDTKDEVFFSDNGNQRIVHISSKGEYIEEFSAPKEELLSQNLSVFDPSKIGITDYTGYIYVLIGKEFMQLDATGSFRGMVGTEPVGFDLIEWLSRTFATEAQKKKAIKREPLPYSNFCITDDNKIYAVSMAASNQIKKINISGENTFPDGFYGEKSMDDKGALQNPVFSDIAVNSYGLITVADQNTSVLYQYNEQGELLAVFGGRGTEKEKFQNISAICYDKKDRLFVLDSAQGQIQILETTEFMEKVHNSVQLYLDGKYDASLKEWETILRQISNYPVAQAMVADIYQRNGNYDEAMDMYRAANIQSGYGTVLGAVRSAFISEHFVVICVSGVLGIALIIALLIYMRRYCVWIEEDLYQHNIGYIKEFLCFCQLTFFHPIQSWDVLKWRRVYSPKAKERVNLIPVIVLPVLLIAARFIYSKYAAFTVNAIDSQYVSLLLETVIVLVVYITLGFSIFKITSVLGGEISFYETFASISYSMLPPIILMPVFTVV